MTTDSFTNVTRRPVIGSRTAESVGSVKGFILSADARTIESVHIGGHGRRAVTLSWSQLQAFGADAVMAAEGAAPSMTDDDHQEAAGKSAVSVIGSRVLTVDGREIGTVDDVEFDTGSGAVVRVTTDHGAIDADRLRSLGSYALVVDDVPPATG